jgi:surfeit locus 1 family protein
MNRKLRRLAVPAASTAAMLAVLIGLGTWQVRRLAWKTDLLKQIDLAEARPAVPLPPDPTPFTKVSATGTMRDDLSALYGAEGRDTRSGPQMGAQLLTPLERPGQAALLVDRGWVPTNRGSRMSAAAGPVTVEGYVRAPDHPGMFSATDDPAKRLFYTLDPAAIGKALGIPLAPFTLVALGPLRPAAYPQPAQALPRPPNDHLSYAITWYGLAATLVVIFLAYARKVIRP